MTTIYCVRVGLKYGPHYVERLRNMVRRYTDAPIVCLTDQPDSIEGVEMVQVTGTGWWAKMHLFNPAIRGKGVYFDLDTVLCGDIAPLLDYDGPFAICANFTKAVTKSYPCRYGSCVMAFPEGFGQDIFDAFMADHDEIVAHCPKGDQQAIERLYPDAVYLQDVMPPGFFVGYRHFGKQPPAGASVLIFAGNKKPHNTPYRWIKELWT